MPCSFHFKYQVTHIEVAVSMLVLKRSISQLSRMFTSVYQRVSSSSENLRQYLSTLFAQWVGPLTRYLGTLVQIRFLVVHLGGLKVLRWVHSKEFPVPFSENENHERPANWTRCSCWLVSTHSTLALTKQPTRLFSQTSHTTNKFLVNYPALRTETWEDRDLPGRSDCTWCVDLDCLARRRVRFYMVHLVFRSCTRRVIN